MSTDPVQSSRAGQVPIRTTLRTAGRLLRSKEFRAFGRRLASFTRRTMQQDKSPDYQKWRAAHVVLDDADRRRISNLSPAPDRLVRFVVRTFDDSSVPFGLTSGPTTPADWMIYVDGSAELHEAATFAFADAISRRPEVVVVYADHEIVGRDGLPIAPHLKPDWNADLALGHAYVGPVLAVRIDHLEKVSGTRVPSSFHDLLLSVTRDLTRDQIHHIPHVLSSISAGHAIAADADAVVRHLAERQIRTVVNQGTGTCRVVWPVPAPIPRVSVVIPTRDRGRMLERCLEGVRHRTSHSDIELVIVDHSSTQRRARHLIDGLVDSGEATVVTYEGPFNFSRMVNLGVGTPTGEVVCLLNNDTEVLDPGWLTELVGQVSRPEVGVVGPLLLFADGSIQHAGVHPGLGGFMGHGHKHRLHGDPGYFGRLTVAHEVAAVTGACLVIERELWDDLGGMDEGLEVAFNDIDLCLRIRQANLRVVFTPHAVLRHHESVSRGVDDDPYRSARLAEEYRRMKQRWGSNLELDPAYHPDLSRDPSGFRLAAEPTTRPPWR